MTAAPSARYSGVAMALHWLIALGTAAAFVPAAGRAGLHNSAGAAVLVLTLAALTWRAGHPPPPLPAWMTRRERHAALLAHLCLWLLLLAVPLTGWLGSGAHGGLAAALLALVALHMAAVVKHRWFDRADLLRRILPRR